MKIILFFLPLLLSLQSIAQVTFIIDDFSDEYYGKLYVSDTSEVFSEGWVAVYRKSNNEELIKVESDNLSYTLYDGELRSNIVHHYYGNHSVLFYDDFNFDGEKDLALSNGNNSCYGGPSFDIYLYDNGGFIYSANFSMLANEYCGMFEYNFDEKRVYTMTKSGCCWHQYSEFVIENNEPKVVRIEEFDGYTNDWPYSMIVTEQVWDGKKMVKRITGKEIRVSDFKIESAPFYLELENGKRVLFFEHISKDEAFLHYTFIDTEGKVEFEYPEEKWMASKFIYTEDGNNYTCSFSNGNAKYTIYDYVTPERKVGIKVTVKGKVYDLKGKPDTVNRTLRAVVGYDNVVEQ